MTRDLGELFYELLEITKDKLYRQNKKLERLNKPIIENAKVYIVYNRPDIDITSIYELESIIAFHNWICMNVHSSYISFPGSYGINSNGNLGTVNLMIKKFIVLDHWFDIIYDCSNLTPCIAGRLLYINDLVFDLRTLEYWVCMLTPYNKNNY